MSILEIALASQIWARRGEKHPLEINDANALKALLRLGIVFAAFSVLIAGLNLAVGRPQMLADGSAPVIGER